MADNAQILAAIEEFTAKAIMPGDFSESILVPEQFDRFIEIVEQTTKILGRTRRIEMTSQQVNIDRTGFAGRVLRAGSTSAGAHRTLTDAESSKPAFFTNKLIAQELVAITGMNDKALRRNLEKGGFIDTLIAMFGRAVSRDLEEFSLRADTAIPYATDDVLSLTDGWLKLAGQQLYGYDPDAGGAAVANFTLSNSDPSTIKTMFQKMLEALDKKYIGDPGEWEFQVSWDIYDGWRNYWLETTNGRSYDDSLSKGEVPAFKGIPVVYVPMLERSNKRKAALQNPDNMCWGVFHEVTVESEREAKDRRTDFVLTVEADMHYEDQNAAVVANIDA